MSSFTFRSHLYVTGGCVLAAFVWTLAVNGSLYPLDPPGDPKYLHDVHLLVIAVYLVGSMVQVMRLVVNDFEDPYVTPKNELYGYAALNVASLLFMVACMYGNLTDLRNMVVWIDSVLSLPLLTLIFLGPSALAVQTRGSLMVYLGYYSSIAAFLVAGQVHFAITTLSCGAMLEPLLERRQALVAEKATFSLEPNEKESQRYYLYLICARKLFMVDVLLLLHALSITCGVLYVTGLLSYLHPTALYVMLTVSSAFQKMSYTSLTRDDLAELYHCSLNQLEVEERLHDIRRQFLRYLFHEVRVPLNAISMGVQLLMESVPRGSNEYDTVMSMHQASIYLGDTLTNLLALQRIEEGTFELVQQPFTLFDLLSVTIESLQEASLRIKKARIDSTIGFRVPVRVIGDNYRIKHVLSALLATAIDRAKMRDSILLSVTASEPFPPSSDETLDKDGNSTARETRLFTFIVRLEENEALMRHSSNMGNASSTSMSSISSQSDLLKLQGQGDFQSASLPTAMKDAANRSSMVVEDLSKIASGYYDTISNIETASSICAEIIQHYGGAIHFSEDLDRAVAGEDVWEGFSIPLEVLTEEHPLYKQQTAVENLNGFLSTISNFESRHTALFTGSNLQDSAVLSPMKPKSSKSSFSTDVPSREEVTVGQHDSPIAKSKKGLGELDNGGYLETSSQPNLNGAEPSSANATTGDEKHNDKAHSTNLTDSSRKLAPSLKLRRSYGGPLASNPVLEDDERESDVNDLDEDDVLPPPRTPPPTDVDKADWSDEDVSAAEAKIIRRRSASDGGVLRNVSKEPASQSLSNNVPPRRTRRLSIDLPTDPKPHRSRSLTHPIMAPMEQDARTFRVLIVEDSIADCTMIRLMLKKRGLTAEIAHNGQEALRVVVGKPITHFDMIMMDKNMPVMGGIDCIKEIRQRGFDHIIVGLTAEFLSQDLKKFEEAGANLAITKPLTHQALDAILMFLDAHGVKNFSHENALLTWEFGRLIAVSTGTGTGNGTGTGTGNGTNNSAAIK